MIRPPVVVVLGHVDHGKTTLLDTIRKTHVQAGEAGGITQHIGAYQVQTDPKDDNTKITFIDTPGHEAFCNMRSRGCDVADLAILVVAANDGVKPQTKEAINLIKNNHIPFIVAINKTDLPDINLDVVKSQLAENDILVEEYGGSATAISISAKNNKGVDELLEMLHLLWQVTYEADKQSKDLSALVLESFVDSSRGTIANILVRSGEIKVGDTLCCGTHLAKVKSMFNQNSISIDYAGPSFPVQILGFKKALHIGSIISSQASCSRELTDSKKESLDQDENTPKLKIILKADVAGTLEAIKLNLPSEIDVIDSGVGDVSESDVLLASSTGAIIIAFACRVPILVKKLAEMETVKIKTYEIIYHLLEYLQEKALKLIEPTINEEVLGTAQIIAEFNIKDNHIAGCKITDGQFTRTQKFKLTRTSNEEEKEISRPRVKIMQVERVETQEAHAGQEVALVFRPDIKFKLGDKVICFKETEE